MKNSSKKEHILVVDDSPDTLEVLQRNLESKGYQISTAPGAVGAIKILESTPMDLVITDLKMPKVNGLSLVRHIQENFRETEVMMITGYPSIEGAVEAVKSGAEEYLSKPFTEEELFSAVKVPSINCMYAELLKSKLVSLLLFVTVLSVNPKSCARF